MKDKIIDTAALFIQKYGLKKFTVDEIAAQLKISKKTIYKYFRSKDDIIREYFDEAITSDENGITNAISENKDFSEKIHAIVYSTHKYGLPISLLAELKQYYPEEWTKIEKLKKFKLNATKNLLKQGADEGIFKQDINFEVLCKILEQISDMFTDYDFLIENHLNTREAIDEALNIIFDGILKK